MSSNSETRVLAFCRPPQEITSPVIDAARRTRTRVIFDISGVEPDSVAMALLQADAGPDCVDLKISPKAIMDGSILGVLQETGIGRVWVELHPMLLEGPVEAYLGRIADLSDALTCFPVVADVNLVTSLLRNHSNIRNIALKGCEAAGFVSSETAFTLYSSARAIARESSEPPNLLIWGGVALAEAAAAFLAAGAGGIVFESVHWLTDLVAIDDSRRDKIAKIRPQHTDLNGLNLDVPCRVFNKGNSRAVKGLRDFAGSLCATEVKDEQRRSFAEKVHGESVHPLNAAFGREELIPIGIEAAFADSFVRRYGTVTEDALAAFAEDIEALCAGAEKKTGAFLNSPVAAELGTTYPFVQGAMSWISDVPQFARSVADAGALPTIALGMMDKTTLERKLGNLPEVMGARPYAINVITLAENPHRADQLAWIRAARPRFAVIAAGEPSHAREFLESGIQVIYIAPNEELLKMAFDAGVRYVICEGNEAGGHVGEHSTLTLAQIILDLKNQQPETFKGRRVILAGGICNRETAFMAAMLGADAVQMGTRYLATKEIVATGALSELYQRKILEAGPGGSVISGESTGLRVRSLKTERIDEICKLERDFAAGAEDEASVRRKIEALAAGSLLIAARGVERPDGAPLAAEDCARRGQFMSGACAGAVRQVTTLEELHLELAQGKLAEGLPFLGPVRTPATPRLTGVDIEDVEPSRQAAAVTRTAYHAADKERIAITGMSIVNSLGNSPEEVWAACLAMKSGIVYVPASRWDHELFYHPRPRTSEKTYCKVGAFQNIEVSRKDVGLPPQDFRTMTDSTKVTMWLAKNAVEQSGILDSDIPRERIGVLISQNSGEAAATLQDVIIRASARDIVSSVARVVALTPEAEFAAAEEVKAGHIAIDDTTLLGRLNCTAGGFISNKYGFQGPSFSVSAACATALVALYSAYQMIRNGIIDAAVVGGAEELLTPMHFLEFSALGALQGLSGVERNPWETSRPFEANRDGMVLGEGGGMIVIERESVARRRGAHIHAFITGMGASNNHLGLVESSRVTQEIAIGASFRDTSYGPEGVQLIECHATSTVQGDVEEIHALKQFYNSGDLTVLTSFKSQIGHTLGASGVNSLIRGIMAMKSGIFPPTLNYEKPDPEIGLEGFGFHVCREPADWNTANGNPRRFEVNAFGFGGSNYVLQVEQVMDGEDRVLISLPDKDLQISEEGGEASLPEGVYGFRTDIGGKPYRVAVVADSEKEALSLIEACEFIADEKALQPKRLRAMARQGVHLARAGNDVQPLAFVFPGQGSHYAGMSHELYRTFPVIREWMDRIAEVADFDILHLLFHDREEDLRKTRWQQPALFTMEYAMVQYLWSLGIRPAALAGHSLGELTALCLAGVYSYADGFRIVNMRALCMDKACEINVDPGIMMATDAPLDYVEERLKTAENVYITNINSLHQVVIGGDTDAVRALGEELKANGYRRTQLRVSMAFHSPIMRCIHDELEAFIADLEFHPPQIPVISNTTMKPFPPDTTEIKRIVMAHLESPVYWLQNVRTMWNDFGVRLFVEVGPRDILSNMIQDTIEDADCIQTCFPSDESRMYRAALAQLYARGNLPARPTARYMVFPGRAQAAAPVPVRAIQSRVPIPTAADPVSRIVQREINAFVLESFGRFLVPGILAAIRAEHNAAYSEQDLRDYLSRTLPSGETAFIPPAAQAQPAQLAGSLGRAFMPPVEDEAPAPPRGKAAAAGPGAHDAGDVTEQIIRIIMDATGYDRDEIEPDMDLREDLAIRSSRLPVIMDSLEGHFGIKIELEDFMDVRTISDIAERISKLAPKDKNPAPAAVRRREATVTAAAVTEPGEIEEKESLKRIVFSEASLETGDSRPVELKATDSVAVLSADSESSLVRDIVEVFRSDYGTNPAVVRFRTDGKVSGGGSDIRSAAGASQIAAKISESASLAGLVFVVDDSVERNMKDIRDVSDLLTGIFTLSKTVLDSSSRKLLALVEKNCRADGLGRVLSEGILGMFLSLAHEFPSVQFRTVRMDDKTEAGAAMRNALNRNCTVLDMICADGNVFTRQGRVVPLTFEDNRKPEIGPDDVVVMSGGGYGISPFIARSLSDLGCRIVFLGRTKIDPQIDFRGLLAQEDLSREDVARSVAEAKPHISGADMEKAVAGVSKALEIIKEVEGLRGMGVDASYYSCDVTDADRVEAVMEELVSRFGRIDAIIHAAGIIKDNMVKEMTPEDFAQVVAVKFLGAWNLYSAAQSRGLKLFACFSSGTAIQGNPGQSNYSCANRVMSALMSNLSRMNPAVQFKAMMLPPVEGAGMAENPEIKALMKRMNAAYVHADELAGLVCRELCFAPKDDVWVLFMRSLPNLRTVRLDMAEPELSADSVRAAAVLYKKEDFPMIDAVSHIDLHKGELIANRVFSIEKDLWIPDHKPFKFLKHPLVSAIMTVETFMEAGRMLYPHLRVLGIRDAQFLDIIECPPGIDRRSVIRCTALRRARGAVDCDVSLATLEIFPSGQTLDRMSTNFRARVEMGSIQDSSGGGIPGFPVKPEELDTRPMDHSEVLKWYEDCSHMQGRYRVIEYLDGTASNAIRGRTTYRQTDDFSGSLKPHYQYSPYLLEALMQAVSFYIVMRNEKEDRSMIPFRIGEMKFLRKCSDGETIILEGRMRKQDEHGVTWDARATDAEGTPVMVVRDMVMRWFTA